VRWIKQTFDYVEMIGVHHTLLCSYFKFTRECSCINI